MRSSRSLCATALCAVLCSALVLATPSHARSARKAHATQTARVPAATGLPAELNRLLAVNKLPASHVSVVVARVDNPLRTRGQGPEPLVWLNADAPRNPASTMKLVTSAAALDLLGPDYRWRTMAYTDGQIDARVLHGNLYIKGTGDPKLVPEEMEKFVAELHRAGIDEIQGDLVLDRSAYDPDIGVTPTIDGGDDRPYNVPPDALLYSFKALSFNFSGNADGTVDVTALPPLAHLTIDNDLSASQGGCGDWLGKIHPDIREQPDGSLVAHFSGTYALACDAKDWAVAAPDRDRFFLGGFLALWQASGGKLTGNVRSGLVSPGARLIATHRGQTLAEVVHDMNKFSNNVMARQLFLSLGLRDDKAPASLTKSRRILAQWLDENDLPMPGLVVDNGSGLSRDERISAASLARLLQHAMNGPTAQVFVESMPVVGVDGTMRNRLADSDAAGNAHIKTGTLEDVRAVAGYVGTRTGSTYVVVSLVNDPRAGASRPFNDALIDWVYRTAP
ncbi:D-alanyl-D-alanine carboxypeptidase DacC [Pandoraea terrae]|uniref:D-alanyl-D-alanine carboxypeptidase DacC n=1 Tax=Pandoraea terrae TaxID=1537710 RepID=A0A5E4UQJ5_9BURK|nr:D-alanyl-D-alanine carboxypeptidase/D-alanyl-D-alanine-endopeptidase [Pandoraea terrae]VVE02248.1 D-alanyl-D-alanine carboxypeptidase DacC [Pandoraea terrae]